MADLHSRLCIVLSPGAVDCYTSKIGGVNRIGFNHGFFTTDVETQMKMNWVMSCKKANNNEHHITSMLNKHPR